MNKTANANVNANAQALKPYGAFNYRPIVLMAIGFGFGILAIKLDNISLVVACAMCIFLTFFAFSMKNKVVFILSFFILFGMFRACIMYPTVYSLETRTQFVQGRVYSVYDDSIVVDMLRINNNRVVGRMLVKRITDEMTIDDEIAFVAELEQTTDMNGSTYQFYLMSEDYTFVTSTARYFNHTGHSPSAHGFFARIHNYISEKIDVIFGYQAALVKGILLGDSSEIPEDSLGNLRDAGLAHLFALSGLHVSILSGVLLFLMRRSNKYVKLSVVTLFLLMYSAVAAFPTSLLRASLMTLVMMLAPLFNRRNDPLSSCSLAFIIITLVNPYQLFAAGFVLSFSAVCGIILMCAPFMNLFTLVLHKKTANSLSVSIAATSGIMPATTAYFHRMPLYSLITNLIAIPIASIAVICAFIGLFVGMIFLPLSVPFAFIVNKVFSGINYVTDMLSKLPFAVLTTQSLSFACGLLYASRMVVMSPYYITRPKYRLQISIALTLLTFAAFLI